MSELAITTLSQAEARSLTDEVKQDAERLWRKLVELYDGGAHLALGYSSWGDYFEAEFRGSASRGYKLLAAGRVVGQLSNGSIPAPATGAQARELAPLLDEPETLREAWAEASTNGTPTAAQVREVVGRRTGVQPVSATPEWAATMNALDGLAHFDRLADRQQAEAEAALLDPSIAAIRGEALNAQRLRRASAWTALLADALERKTDA